MVRSFSRLSRVLLSLAVLCLLHSFASAAPGRKAEGQSPFAIRGIKGLWWEGFDSYDKALPWVADHGMNFLMFCYTSFPQSAKDWRQDYTPEQLRHFARLAKESDRRGVNLCLSFNPGIWSQPPLGYSDEADYQTAWRKVRDGHAAGLRWFALCLDDIHTVLTPPDKEKFGTLEAAQVHFVNRLWKDMKTLSPRPHLIFCPSAYTTGTMKQFAEYTRVIGEQIDPEIMLFWTGPEVCSPHITVADAREAAALLKRKPLVWDNYPVNDMFPWRPLLSPVKNRAADLSNEVAGIMANTMKQWDLDPIPLATFADYYRAPAAYDPAKSIAKAIDSYPKAQRPAIRLLVDLYGSSFWGEKDFPPQPRPANAEEARALLPKYQRLRTLLSETPGLQGIWDAAKPTVEKDIADLQAKAG